MTHKNSIFGFKVHILRVKSSISTCSHALFNSNGVHDPVSLFLGQEYDMETVFVGKDKLSLSIVAQSMITIEICGFFGSFVKLKVVKGIASVNIEY